MRVLFLLLSLSVAGCGGSTGIAFDGTMAPTSAMRLAADAPSINGTVAGYPFQATEALYNLIETDGRQEFWLLMSDSHNTCDGITPGLVGLSGPGLFFRLFRLSLLLDPQQLSQALPPIATRYEMYTTKMPSRAVHGSAAHLGLAAFLPDLAQSPREAPETYIATDGFTEIEELTSAGPSRGRVAIGFAADSRSTALRGSFAADLCPNLKP